MKRSLVAAAALAALALVVSACGDDDVSYVQPSGKGQHATSGQGATQKDKTKPTMTPGQKRALESAKLYLGIGSGFSRSGLIVQLHSESGEGLPLRDSVWAVDHSHADWDAQAVEAARTYKKIGGFSKQALLAQLASPTGDGFTPAQASYAVQKVFG